MSLVSGAKGSITILAIVSMGFLAFVPVAHADISRTGTVDENLRPNAQVKKLTDDAKHALQIGDASLAIIDLKNALRLMPDDGALDTLLGIAFLQNNDAVPAEHELRQARLHGAPDQDVLPPLWQSMIINREWQDLLDQFAEPSASDRSQLAASLLSVRALAYQSLNDDSDANSSIDRSLAIRRNIDGLLVRVRIAMLQSNASDAMAYVNQALALAPNDTNALLLKAEIISVSDKITASAMIDNILKGHPNLLTAIMAKIDVLLELGRNDEAQQFVSILDSRAPNLSFTVFCKALLLGLHNKPLEGWRIAQTLPALFVQSEARFALVVAQLAVRSGNLESANSILTTYVGQHPAESEPRLQLAALHLKMSNPSDALNDLAPLMDSKDPRVLEFIATTYATLKQQSDSIVYLRKAEAAGDKSGALKYQLAMVDLQQGDTSHGMQEMLAGMKMQPGNLNAPQAGIELLIKQGKFVEAQTLAAQAEKMVLKSPAPPFFTGEILSSQGKLDAGLVAINQSLQRDPHYLPALFARAKVFMAQNKYADATKDLKLAQVLQPNDPLPYVKLAEIAYLSKQPLQSIALLKQAISKDPNQIAPRLTLASYQSGLKQYSDALATLKAALQIFPNNPQALALQGEVQQESGQMAGAIATNKLLVEKYQQSGDAQAQLANSLLASGDKKGAIAAFRRATELSPEILQYRLMLIDVQTQVGDNEGALATARAWANYQKGPDAAILLAGMLMRLKRLSEAASVIAASQATEPNAQLTILDSQIALERGDLAHGILILKNWLANHTSDVSVREAYASLLMRTGDNVGALAQYEMVLKNRNDDPSVLNNIAWLIRNSDPSRALNLAYQARQQQPNSPDIDDTLGMLLLNKGDAKGALPVLQQAHAIEPANGEFSYHLALALNVLGRKTDAKQVIQAALAKDDHFEDVADAKRLLQKL